MVGALALAAALAACVVNPPPSGGTASAPRIQVTEQSRSGLSSSSVWVISAVGFDVRAAPPPQADIVTTVTQSARLDISEKRTVGSDTWLHVKTESGQFQGWVLDRADLVIHRAMSLHVEGTSGYSILFPNEW